MFKFILRDSGDSQFDDLIIFENKVNKYDVKLKSFVTENLGNILHEYN